MALLQPPPGLIVQLIHITDEVTVAPTPTPSASNGIATRAGGWGQRVGRGVAVDVDGEGRE